MSGAGVWMYGVLVRRRYAHQDVMAWFSTGKLLQRAPEVRGNPLFFDRHEIGGRGAWERRGLETETQPRTDEKQPRNTGHDRW